MHRSGTSALAGTLVRMGAQAPATLMPPTEDNPKGYWESTALMGLHERVLASAGSGWDDWSRIDPAWFASAAGQEFRGEIAGLVDSEFGDASLLVLKDPRVCRLLPLWRAALADLGIEANAVIALRDPGEVADSLTAREGFHRSHGLLLWLRHLLDAEVESRSMTRCFVQYEDLLGDWRQTVAAISAQTGIEWPSSVEAVEGDLDEFLESRLRHHDESRADTTDDTLGAWLVDTTGALARLASAPGDDETLGALDRVRHEFDRNSAPYGEATRDRVVRLRAQVRGGQAEAERLHARVADLERHVLGSRSEIERQTHEIERQTHEIAALTRRTLEAENAGRETTKRARAEASRAARAASKAERNRGKLQARLTTTQLRVRALNAELEALKRSRSWRLTAPIRSTGRRMRKLWRRYRPGARTEARRG